MQNIIYPEVFYLKLYIAKMTVSLLETVHINVFESVLNYSVFDEETTEKYKGALMMKREYM